MKFIALVFAIVAIVPQALRGMAFGLARINECTLPATECEIGGNDQSHVLNLLWGPSFWTTTGLWIGGAGLVASLVVLKLLAIIENRKATSIMIKADRRSGVGQAGPRDGSGHRDGTNGRMPRPPGFDRHGRPRT